MEIDRPAPEASGASAGAPPAAIAQEGMTIQALLQLLYRRRRLIAWIVLGGVIGAVVFAALLPRHYTAKSQVIVEDMKWRPGASGAGPDQAAIQTEVTALSSYDLLAGAVAQLAADPAFRSLQRRRAGSIPDLTPAVNRPLAVHRIEKHLHVFQELGSDVVSITYTSPDPAEASVICNTITAYYLTTGGDQSRRAVNEALAILSAKLATLREQAASRDAAVAAYQAAHGVNAYRTTVTDDELADLNRQLSRAEAELAVRRTRYEALAALRGGSGDWSGLLTGVGTQGLLDLNEQTAAVLQGRQTSIFFARTAAGANGARERSVTLSSLRETVRRGLDQVLVKLSNDERLAVAQLVAIERRLGAVRRASEDVGLRDLVAAAVGAHQRYDRLLDRRNQLLEQADDVSAPARLLTWAHIPLRPSSLNPLLYAVPALALFLVLGGLAAIVRDQLDQGIYREADVGVALGAPCAGVVRLLPDPHGGEISPISLAAACNDLRAVMVSLRLTLQGRQKPQALLVTSVRSDEGRAALARMLAMCEAAAGAKVLLLTCDERTGAAGASLPAVDPAGGGKFARTVDEGHGVPPRMTAGVDHLSIRRSLAGEPSPPVSVEQMAQLLREHRAGYDLIVIDGGAVLANAEVRLLAAVADHILLALQWGRTRRDNARAALALLRSCGPDGGETAATISVAITQPAGGHASPRAQEQPSWPRPQGAAS